jgi:hypothetical protein
MIEKPINRRQFMQSVAALTLAQGFRAALDELGKHGKTMNMAAMKMSR